MSADSSGRENVRRLEFGWRRQHLPENCRQICMSSTLGEQLTSLCHHGLYHADRDWYQKFKSLMMITLVPLPPPPVLYVETRHGSWQASPIKSHPVLQVASPWEISVQFMYCQMELWNWCSHHVINLPNFSPEHTSVWAPCGWLIFQGQCFFFMGRERQGKKTKELWEDCIQRD